MKRREFLRTSGGLGIIGLMAPASSLAVKSPVLTEMERRLKYLTPPQGTPPDLLANPSPPVTPFVKYDLDKYRPPIAQPLFLMTGPVLEADWPGADRPTQPIEQLSNEAWWAVFESRFLRAQHALSTDGFSPPAELQGENWPVRGDQALGPDGRIRIDIGDPPRPERHQRFWELRPRAFFINREVEFAWEFHPQYGSASLSWGYHAVYAQQSEDTTLYRATRPCSPGPTFHARYGEPILTRRLNDLPEIGHTPGHARIKFALPSTTSHLHNAHTASESDGFPNDWLNPGEYWDHHYGNFPSGHDDREKLSTLWYHDHRMDFTASNVYAGLDGFYLLFDERDAMSGDLNDETQGWHLPSGDYDIPLILHDLAFAQEKEIKDENDTIIGMAPREFSMAQTTRWTFDSAQDWDDLDNTQQPDRGRVLATGGPRKAIKHKGYEDSSEKYEPSPQLIFDGFNTDGIIGDRWTVNRRVQPLLEVEARKYRLRLLNGGPSRFYDLYLHADDSEAEPEPTSAYPRHRYGLGEKRYKSPSSVPEAAIYQWQGPDEWRRQKGEQEPGDTMPPKPTSELEHAFVVICGDGNFQPNPVLANSVYLGVAQRVDVVIDFSQFSPGTLVYIVNRLEQSNGRGPTERFIDPSDYNTDEDFFKANAVTAFKVVAAKAEDQSRMPLLFRDFPPIDFTEVKRERLWEFDYDGGLWTINGHIFDPNRIDAGIEQDSAEIWTFRNAGNGWHHPIHSHFTEFLILERNNRPFSQGNIQTDLLRQEEGPARGGAGGFASRGALGKVFGSSPKYRSPHREKREAMEENGGQEIQRAVGVLRERLPAYVTEKRPSDPDTSRKMDELVQGFPQAVRDARKQPYGTPGPISRLRSRLVDLGIPEPAIILILDRVSARFGLRELRRQVRDARDERGDSRPDEHAIDTATDLLIKWHPEPQERADVVEKIRSGEFDGLAFLSYDEFADWVYLMPELGLGEPLIDRFMGGARRDVAVLQPNTEVTVFARWKDFLGKHVMHCHNVVHEDHAMMIRWEIVPKNQGFDVPRHVDEVTTVGEPVEEERREHVESHPLGSAAQPDDH